MNNKGAVVHGCVLLILLCKLNLDKLGELLGKGPFGIVRKAVHISTQKEYAIKMSNLEAEMDRKVADAEKESLELLKGFSPYLMNLNECFDEVCYVLTRNFFY
jgi:serine/threonine protein kinase